MIKKDLIKEAATALSSNKVRTGLTVLGIVVGIASVIVLSAIGNGAKANITEEIQSNGSNLITIVNGSPRAMDGKGFAQKGSGKTLTVDDYNAIKSIDNIAYSSPMLSKSAQLVVDGNNSRSTINGVNADYKNIRNLELSSGSFLSENNNKSSDKVIVLGSSLKDDLFNNEEAVGKQVRVNGIIFDVIGVLKSASSGFNNSDNDA
ncbi:MAG: ABC transporter permease [Candidatus Pacebacteria bacterium]|nr:ABC transporter permease [Candidatus Paceibacterota bacterium]